MTARNARTNDGLTREPDPLAIAKGIIETHLRGVSQEILTWQRTGLLPPGRLREAADALKPDMGHAAIDVAKKLAADAAHERITATPASPSKQAVTIGVETLSERIAAHDERAEIEEGAAMLLGEADADRRRAKAQGLRLVATSLRACRDALERMG